ncbi:pantoate--beta-alanine ligase [Motiliproteus coralliicola]|uniref:Pantothenate synthetase n=1 Tax=Motiliproteus coralliicola TaxID=2283196 RepID=A0A369WCZ5_9GAMM|nr:pantoate--beta-alanine ligase [Motiliproteus coralliicola]RDE19049.1 pantoate--beta-alanine ligase [Motiliproteus coralliicola]
MRVLNTVESLQSVLQSARESGKTIGFVPTMGNLHQGHLSLVEKAGDSCDLVVVSIFVNPLQFAAGEDLDTYPRTLAEDRAKLEQQGCDILFAPTVAEMYPEGQRIETQVDLPTLSQMHCGITRPHFFKGVATVVVKLLCMVLPTRAFFGEKDRQQLTIIRQVVKDLSLPVVIEGVPTIREPSGLAMSSRNGYLSDAGRERAAYLYRLLSEVREQIEQGARDYPALQQRANQALAAEGFEPDYFHICQQQSLQPASESDRELAILAAAKLDGTRLIDNIAFRISPLA